MKDLKLTLIQTSLYWEDAEKNLSHFDLKLNDIIEPTDIIILPEMFTTGFTMYPEKFAEEHGGKSLQWMLQKAKEKSCVITGSVSIKHNGHFYNRLYWAMPDGTYNMYDKRHLFRMGNEHMHYTAGSQTILINYKGWNICPLICYDLRFPVWSRNRKSNTYDLAIYVANWPEVRAYPWKQLLIARAIENQAYVVGVNRIGIDGNGISHAGNSTLINPRAEIIAAIPCHADKIETVTLSNSYLQDFRKTFPVMMDGDEFDLH